MQYRLLLRPTVMRAKPMHWSAIVTRMTQFPCSELTRLPQDRTRKRRRNEAITFEEQRAKELAALGNYLTSIEECSALELLMERVSNAFDAVNELQDCGLISRRERVYWGDEFNAASSERLATL